MGKSKRQLASRPAFAQAGRLVVAAFGLWIFAGIPAARAEAGPPILDVRALPTQDATVRTLYEARFLNGNLPRAFAVSANGLSGFASGMKSVEAAREAALEVCAKKGGVECRIYAENLDVVWPGRTAAGAARTPGPLIEGTGYSFVPDDRFIWHGPQAARGIYVWSHGKGDKDARGLQPQPHVRWFNNAGFDVVRFDRALEWDGTDRAAQWLREGLAELRKRGWRTVIAGGQSRGAWNSLQILDTPGLADVVIAISPAAHGTDTGSVALRQGPQLYNITHDARSPKTRVAFVQFSNDPYSDDPADRVAKMQTALFPRVGAGLLIDRPDGITGHGGGAASAFNERFGQCLLRFATDATPPSHC
eukprot:gene14982-15126_t